MPRNWVVLGILVAGCAPPASLRPAMSTMASTRNELGAGVVSIRPRPFADDPVETVGQLWGTRRFTKNLKLSGIVAFDTEAAAAGTSLAWLPLRTSNLAVGGAVELGYAWVGVSLPCALQLGKLVTLYASPRLGSVGDSIGPALPAGVDIKIENGFSLRTEAQVSWVDFEPYNRRLHVAFGIGYGFGANSKWANTGK